MKNYVIETVNGVDYRVFPSGGRLRITANRLPHIPKEAGVYKITDNTTGKSYIGSSSNVNLRLCNYTSSNMKRITHLKGFDFNNCTVAMIENCKYLTTDQRLQVELECIIKHNTIWPNGYNKRSPVTGRVFGNEDKPYKKKVRIPKEERLKETPQVIKQAKAWVNVLREHY